MRSSCSVSPVSPSLSLLLVQITSRSAEMSIVPRSPIPLTVTPHFDDHVDARFDHGDRFVAGGIGLPPSADLHGHVAAGRKRESAVLRRMVRRLRALRGRAPGGVARSSRWSRSRDRRRRRRWRCELHLPHLAVHPRCPLRPSASPRRANRPPEGDPACRPPWPPARQPPHC